MEAKGDDELELLSLAAKVPFDDRFCQRASVADLAQSLMLGFLREVDSALADDADALPGEAVGRQINVVEQQAALPTD